MQIGLFIYFPELLEVKTPTQIVKISTLYHNFSLYYCWDFSFMLHICTSPRINSLVNQAWILVIFYKLLKFLMH